MFLEELVAAGVMLAKMMAAEAAALVAVLIVRQAEATAKTAVSLLALVAAQEAMQSTPRRI